jgi:methylmalonyl-CoA mutase N-terminal domain/subunit
MGGAVNAIEAGFQMEEIEEAAFAYTKSIDDASRTIVGVNKFTDEERTEMPVLKVDAERERNQVAHLREFKAKRDNCVVVARLDDVRAAARGTDNLLYPMKEALRANATLGEVSDALRDVFGVHRPG